MPPAPVPAPWTRRRFLRCGASTAGLLASASLWACARHEDDPDAARAPAPLPRRDDLAVDPSAPLERGGVLRIFEWRDYLDHDVVAGFVRRHADLGVDVRIESFTSMPEAIAALQAPGARHDLFFPTIEALPGLVAAGLLRPLAHDALPHLDRLWPSFRSDEGPFYDAGLGYSVPYTVYSTGIAWREDLLGGRPAPDTLANPYDAYWATGYRGGTGLVDDYREGVAMGILRRGGDLAAPSSEDADGALADLRTLAGAVDLEVSADGPYEELQTGAYAIQQAWSGDVLAAKRFGPGTTATLRRTGFVWPAMGVVGCDLMAVCSRGRNPMLAHAFIDYLLEDEVALDNFAWNGYQPPVLGAVREAFDEPGFPWAGLVPPHLRGALLTPEEFACGVFLPSLERSEDARWRAGWRELLAAVG
jgi:spermidine/putrescine transport system substrate-binding protein